MLVGEFLFNWAVMETVLNSAIGAALELDTPQEFIVTKNIQLRDKIKILKASISLVEFDEPESKSLKKTLNQIADFSNRRNMLAHDLFAPSEKSDGVSFLTVKASDTLDLSETDWSINDFHEANQTLESFSRSLEEIRDRISGRHVIMKIAKILYGGPTSPNASTLPPEPEGTQPPRSLGALYSRPPQANPETDPQTPADPSA